MLYPWLKYDGIKYQLKVLRKKKGIKPTREQHQPSNHDKDNESRGSFSVYSDTFSLNEEDDFELSDAVSIGSIHVLNCDKHILIIVATGSYSNKISLLERSFLSYGSNVVKAGVERIIQ